MPRRSPPAVKANPCYVIAEMRVIDPAGFAKNFAALFKSIALKRLHGFGGRFIVQNTHPRNLRGKFLSPVTNVVRFASIDKAKAAYASAEMQRFDALAKRYVKIRRYILETP